MGLDVTLGIIVLITAIRGWLRGFVYQAVRIAGLIACVYLADPVRNQARPYILPHLPTIQPDLVDRLLWWVSAAVSYVVLVGLTTLLIKITRRPEIPGIPQASRNDQFAGFLVGIAKGALIAAFLAAGIQKYALKQVATISWADEQVKSSWALRCNAQYQPAARVWSSVPVQHFVNHIQRMGLQVPAPTVPPGPKGKAGEGPVVQTASRPPGMELPGPREPEPDVQPAPDRRLSTRPRWSPIQDPELEQAVEELKAHLDAAAKPSKGR
jgi:uncharacterized membrane protein required for colicin V production